MLKLSIFLIAALCHITSAIYAKTTSNDTKPNVIIMHVNNMRWSDLGIHVNKADNENSTPNIDRLAYASIILNRFYGNGGRESLYSGCYQHSSYGNTNLLTTYFERDGYNVNSVAVTDFHHVESFERQVLALISKSNSPFLLTVDFGYLGVDIKIPFVDDIVGAMIMKAHEAGVIDNTIVIFVSLPDDNNELPPIESNIRRSAFIYSPLLTLQQRVSNQLFHISDILPTLVSMADLKWRTKDRYFIDGVNQYEALNTNDDVRTAIYGDNFYISNNWKLSYGTTSNNIYDSSSNQVMESDKNKYDTVTYIKSLLSAEIHVILGEMPASQIMLMRNRAKVHCNVNEDEASETFILNIKCSRVSPCLFDLLNDPCELDDKREAEYELKRTEMKVKLEAFLNKEEIDREHTKTFKDDADHSHHDHEISNGIDPILTPSGGWDAFVTLGLTLFAFIFTFGIIVCFKERCNTRRSVYGSKVTFTDESGKKKEDYVTKRGAQAPANRVMTLSEAVERTHL